MLRLLFVTLEFVEPIFSGNGVYSRSLVRILASLSNVHIMVLCGRQADTESCATDSSITNDWGSSHERVQVLSVPLPVWRKLDRASSWEEFGPLAASQHLEAVASFKPAVMIGVDWTSLGVYQALRAGAAEVQTVPLLYFNFRVFYASTDISEEDRAFYKERERMTIEASHTAVALCKVDAHLLRDLLGSSINKEERQIHILMPCLRHEVATMALEHNRSSSDRRYITVCARLTPEKNVMGFVQAVSLLAPKLKRRGIVPLLIGSPTDPEYAEQVKAALQKDFPSPTSEVIGFVNPATLASYFKRTLLNIHPALYEAYGMTVAEAAAFGAPSLMDSGGRVGVADLLTPPEFSFAVDMNDAGTAAQRISQILGLGDESDGTEAKGASAAKMKRIELPEPSQEVAARARERSLDWGEAQLGRKLLALLQEIKRDQ